MKIATALDTAQRRPGRLDQHERDRDREGRRHHQQEHAQRRQPVLAPRAGAQRVQRHGQQPVTHPLQTRRVERCGHHRLQRPEDDLGGLSRITGSAHGVDQLRAARAFDQVHQQEDGRVHQAPGQVAAQRPDQHRPHVHPLGLGDAERAGEGQGHDQAEQDLGHAVDGIEQAALAGLAGGGIRTGHRRMLPVARWQRIGGARVARHAAQAGPAPVPVDVDQLRHQAQRQRHADADQGLGQALGGVQPRLAAVLQDHDAADVAGNLGRAVELERMAQQHDRADRDQHGQRSRRQPGRRERADACADHRADEAVERELARLRGIEVGDDHRGDHRVDGVGHAQPLHDADRDRRRERRARRELDRPRALARLHSRIARPRAGSSRDQQHDHRAAGGQQRSCATATAPEYPRPRSGCPISPAPPPARA